MKEKEIQNTWKINKKLEEYEHVKTYLNTEKIKILRSYVEAKTQKKNERGRYKNFKIVIK